jgi:excisionase family DNA binding protein
MTNALTIRDVALRLQVGQHTVLGFIHSGELKAINVGRRPGAKKPLWRIMPEALQAFEELRTPTPPPPRARRKRRPAEVIEFYK